MQAHGLAQGARQGSLVLKSARDGEAVSAHGGAELEVGVGNHRFPGVLQQHDVRAGVADVVEAALKAGLQAGQLVAAGQVGPAVAGQHLLKQAQVIADQLGQPRIRPRGQKDAAAFAMLCFQPRPQRLIVGQVGRVEHHALGQPRLQVGFAARDPAGDAQRGRRIPAHQQQQRVDQRVALDQGAVQVDAQRA
jgi:hypothetical protein